MVGLLGGFAARAQTIDGTRDANYPAALAVQTNSTGFGDSNTGSPTQANGDELDNLHAQIAGSDLYLFIGGNLQTNFNKLELFFDTKAGGQNVLRGDNPNVDSNGLNRMAGLKFDAGFESDYYLMVTAGTNQLYVNVAETPTAGGGGGIYAGGGTGLTHTVNFNPAGPNSPGEVSLDNSNVAGVSGSAVNNPGAVATGIEFRIPLAALGLTPGGGTFRLAAFINGGGHSFVANQALGGLDFGIGNLGDPATADFSAQPGNQFVTIVNNVPPVAPVLGVSPASLRFFNVGVGSPRTRTFTITNTGGGTLSVTGITSSNATFSAAPATAALGAGASATVTVTFAPTAAGLQTGTLSIASNAGTGAVAVRGTGVAAGQVVIDGSVDAGYYGPAKALQTAATQFGDNTATTGGSELDGAYARVEGSDLYVTLTGNLESGGNKILLFFDANPEAGQQTFQASNPSVDFGNSANLAGLTFDRGFRPESFLSLSTFNGSLFANYALMNGAGGSGTYLSAGSQEFTQPLDFGGGVLGEAAFDNANVGGITNTTTTNAGAVTTGLEIRIPLSVLGGLVTGTTPVHLMALVANGNYDYLSNQTLGGLPAANGTANLGVDGSGGGSLPFTIDFLNYAGNQFFTAQRGDLTVSDARDLAGDYANVTIAPAGDVRVFSPLDVSGTLTAQGTLQFQNKADAVLSGAGTASISGSLVVSSPAGIAASGATGNVQTATRGFGSGAQYVYAATTAGSTGTGLPATVRELVVNTPATLALTQNVAVTTALTLTQGVLATGPATATLGPAATLAETAASYVTGQVAATRTLATSGAPESFGNLGLTLTPGTTGGASLPGPTTVLRTTGTALMGQGTSTSVLRYFTIQPTVNTGLSVDLTFAYFDHELNGIAEPQLRLFESVGGPGGPFAPRQAGYSANAAANTVSIPGLSSLALFTLGSAGNPLPVELVAFSAEVRGEAVQLAWRTASEVNSAYFAIERSPDGRAFATIGEQAGQGTKTSPTDYLFLDDKPAGASPDALTYYRLRQVDTDGTARYSAVHALARSPRPGGARLEAYPTLVADGQLHLRYFGPALAPDATLTVYSLAGQRLRQLPARGLAGLSLEGLAPGSYLVCLATAGRRVQARFAVR